eukprot:GILJ01006124.1.p1 GENE.GILJ01006124.1~~GILJ01006124.1.p1  ORF type:complete len:647 (-),score=85.40 GILJ01006124.1:299-2239(-)
MSQSGRHCIVSDCTQRRASRVYCAAHAKTMANESEYTPSPPRSVSQRLPSSVVEQLAEAFEKRVSHDDVRMSLRVPGMPGYPAPVRSHMRTPSGGVLVMPVGALQPRDSRTYSNTSVTTSEGDAEEQPGELQPPSVIKKKLSANISPLPVVDEDSTSPQFDGKGFLDKQTKYDVHKWQKRWVVVTQETLKYYKRQKDSNPAGTISLEGARVERTAGSSPDRAFCFLLVTRQRKFVFSAPTELSLACWISCLQRLLTVTPPPVSIAIPDIPSPQCNELPPPSQDLELTKLQIEQLTAELLALQTNTLELKTLNEHYESDLESLQQLCSYQQLQQASVGRRKSQQQIHRKPSLQHRVSRASSVSLVRSSSSSSSLSPRTRSPRSPSTLFRSPSSVQQPPRAVPDANLSSSVSAPSSPSSESLSPLPAVSGTPERRRSLLGIESSPTLGALSTLAPELVNQCMLMVQWDRWLQQMVDEATKRKQQCVQQLSQATATRKEREAQRKVSLLITSRLASDLSMTSHLESHSNGKVKSPGFLVSASSSTGVDSPVHSVGTSADGKTKPRGVMKMLGSLMKGSKKKSESSKKHKDSKPIDGQSSDGSLNSSPNLSSPHDSARIETRPSRLWLDASVLEHQRVRLRPVASPKTMR